MNFKYSYYKTVFDKVLTLNINYLTYFLCAITWNFIACFFNKGDKLLPRGQKLVLGGGEKKSYFLYIKHIHKYST